MHKTQVLVNQTNDHHRTRLTHTLEVAQISRTIARRLGLNEDLTEAIALSHDLGHPPFGHAGESGPGRVHARPRRLRAQPPRPAHVELLEYRYADFPGLNLSWEVREAQAMHSKRPEAAEVARLPRRRPAAPGSPGGRRRRQPGLRQPRRRRRPERRPDHADDLAEVPFWKQAVEQRLRRAPARSGPEQFQPTVVRS